MVRKLQLNIVRSKPIYRENILILDFGGQYTQLIGRRVRELSVYCEIVPYYSAMEKIRSSRPVGVILSGGPDSVCRDGSPSLPPEFFSEGLPILGICYGLQLMSHNLGGQVIPGGDRREFGKAIVEVVEPDTLFAGLPEKFQAWMSHGDRVVKLPSGFKILAQSGNIIASAADESRRIWGVQFHPEVIHTHYGTKILENFPFPRLRLQARMDNGGLYRIRSQRDFGQNRL